MINECFTLTCDYCGTEGPAFETVIDALREWDCTLEGPHWCSPGCRESLEDK